MIICIDNYLMSKNVNKRQKKLYEIIFYEKLSKLKYQTSKKVS